MTSTPRSSSNVADLPKVPHPYSAIALAPDRLHAAAACKNTLLTLRVHPLRVQGSLHVGHYFANTTNSNTASTTNMVLVVLTALAWSQTNVLAAAGSNGVIVLWKEVLEQQSLTPLAVLSQHTRAVNQLAWNADGTCLLSASQDGTILVWEESNEEAPRKQQQRQKKQKPFRFWAGPPSPLKTTSKTYVCKATVDPKSEAVRDVQWSPFYQDSEYA